MSFNRRNVGEVVLWVGTPDCQAAHDYLLLRMNEVGADYLITESAFSNSVKGNIGEFVAFDIARQHDHADYIPFPANAFKPLNPISRPELDIVWLYFGPTELDDVAVLQEVKATGNADLNYADALISDYDKLFGEDVQLTLHSRLQAIKNEVQYKLQREDLCPRISTLAGNGPRNSPRVRLLPTLFHELNGSSPEVKMVAVRSAIIGKGWPSESVKAWAIGLSEFDNRLRRLALGQH